MKRMFVIVCSAIGLLSCNRYPSHLTAPEQIQVVVFEHVIIQKLGKRAFDNDSSLLFLGVGEPNRDPSKAVLDYVSRSFPGVRPSSASAPRYRGKFFEKGTGKQGIAIHVEPFRVDGDDSVSVKASYRVAGKHAEGFEYHLRRENGHWIILDRKQLWIA